MILEYSLDPEGYEAAPVFLARDVPDDLDAGERGTITLKLRGTLKLQGQGDGGGIRIEDDVRITNAAPEVLTDVPKSVAQIEALVGSGRPPSELLA